MIKLHLPNKKIRAEVIKLRYGRQRVVCFSCGNATAALESVGVNVISVSPRSVLTAQDYISPAEVERMFNAPDVTSGSLSPYLMNEIGKAYMETISRILSASEITTSRFIVPCGSGETLMALANFIPLRRMLAYYSPYEPAINFNDWSPLYWFIKQNVSLLELGKGENNFEYLDNLLQDKNAILIETKEG